MMWRRCVVRVEIPPTSSRNGRTSITTIGPMAASAARPLRTAPPENQDSEGFVIWSGSHSVYALAGRIKFENLPSRAG